MSKIIFDNEPIIFTTGAFLKPVKVTDSTSKEIWMWVVSQFEDDSFLNGETYNPKEFANTKDELILNPFIEDEY